MFGSCSTLLLMSGTAVLMLVSAKEFKQADSSGLFPPSCYHSLRYYDDAQLPDEVLNKVHQWKTKDLKIGDKPDVHVCDWGTFNCQTMICVKDGNPIFAVNACGPPNRQGGCDNYINNACKGTFNCSNCAKDLCNKERIELPPQPLVNATTTATTYASSRSTTTSAGVRLLLMMIIGGLLSYAVSIIHCAMAVLLVV